MKEGAAMKGLCEVTASISHVGLRRKIAPRVYRYGHACDILGQLYRGPNPSAEPPTRTSAQISPAASEPLVRVSAI